MDKCIRLSIVALNEPEAFAAVEKLYGTGGFFSGKFPARGTTAAAILAMASTTIGNIYKIAFDLNVRSRNLPAAVNERKAQCLAFGETFQARAFYLTDMDKNIFAATILYDEAKTLLRIKKFNRPGAFANNLVRHTAAASGAACITVRPRISFYGRTAITLISIEVFVTEAVALVPASTSPVSVKTHS
jgi:hypothetical protein